MRATFRYGIADAHFFGPVATFGNGGRPNGPSSAGPLYYPITGTLALTAPSTGFIPFYGTYIGYWDQWNLPAGTSAAQGAVDPAELGGWPFAFAYSQNEIGVSPPYFILVGVYASELISPGGPYFNELEVSDTDGNVVTVSGGKDTYFPGDSQPGAPYPYEAYWIFNTDTQLAAGTWTLTFS